VVHPSLESDGLERAVAIVKLGIINQRLETMAKPSGMSMALLFSAERISPCQE